MKNVFKLSLLVFLLVSGGAKAADELDVKVTEKRTITIELDNNTKGTVLLFRGKNGEILFRDSLQLMGHYKRSLDLEVIPNGVYLLSLERENSILTREVVKSPEGVELTGNPSQITFKPCFRVMEREVKVFLTNPGQKTAYFEVYDNNGELVTTVTNRESVIKKSLDFSRVPAGDYIIKVRVGEHTFFKNLKFG
jgi:hypothetical protein